MREAEAVVHSYHIRDQHFDFPLLPVYSSPNPIKRNFSSIQYLIPNRPKTRITQKKITRYPIPIVIPVSLIMKSADAVCMIFPVWDSYRNG